MTDLPPNPPAADTRPVIWKLRRARRFWRVLFLLALVVAAGALWARFGEGTGDTAHIARVGITGVIRSDLDRELLFAELAEDDNVKGVILAINSPGGTTAGGEQLYEAVTKLRAKKPVVTTVDELGASAAYMTAIASDRIFVRRSSIVASIGVLIEHTNYKKLLDFIGIERDKVQTGPLKAEPDETDPLEGAVRAEYQGLIDDTYQWFVDIVAERRGLDRASVLRLADGRIMTGRQALAAKLIDEVGGEAEAKAWLEANKGVPADLPIISVWPPAENLWDNPLRWFLGQAKAALGLADSGPMSLDGLASLWQGSAAR